MQNTFKSCLEDFGFHQLIEKATHDEGHGLDHVYVSNVNIFPKENKVQILPGFHNFLQFELHTLCIFGVTLTNYI